MSTNVIRVRSTLLLTRGGSFTNTNPDLNSSPMYGCCFLILASYYTYHNNI